MPVPESGAGAHPSGALRLTGALVFDTAAQALRGAQAELRDGHHETLDLEGVTAVDSAGLACVLAVLATARRHGGSLRVVNIPTDLVALAQVCEVQPLLA